MTVTQFKEWLVQDEEQEKLFAKVDWNYYEKKENWIKEFQNWNRLQPQRIKVLEKWLTENNKNYD